MKKIIPTVFLYFLLTQAFAQAQKRVSTYLWLQYNETLYDNTMVNNSRGFGLGLQAFLNNQTKFKPTLELTAEYYASDKSFPIMGITSLFAGSSYHLGKYGYFSFVAGPSFLNKQTLLGIKPSGGLYFSEKRRWSMKCSYVNFSNRGKTVKKDFGIVSFAFGLRLF